MSQELILTAAISLMLGVTLTSLVWLWVNQQIRQRLAEVAARAESEAAHTQNRLAALEAERQNLNTQWLATRDQVQRLESDKAHLTENLDKLQADRDSMKQEFARLSSEALETQAGKLAQSQQDRLGLILNPLRDKIREFEQKVDLAYQQESRERFALKKEIEQLAALNQVMGEEARNLTRALKGDAKAQGNWGEVILGRVLELSGLREGAEFTVQAKEFDLRDPDGRRLQPDVIVHLPEGRHLVVDAKVSLTAYERMVSAENEAERNLHLRQHLESVKTHIQQLSQKNYAQLPGLNSPDFVFLFLAIEPAFSLAIQHEPELFAFAWDRRILLVSPATLLATLKTVASVWKLEHQNRNSQEIARQGGLLYDKLVSMVEEFQQLGKTLHKADETYQLVMRRLHMGRGNLVSRAERLRELGIAPQKGLPLSSQEFADEPEIE